MTSASIIIILAVVQTASCGYCSFASRLEEASIYQEPGTYFDCDHKLPCAGNIVSWHYCYYSADLAPYRNAYWIQVQVFRDIENSSFHHVYGQHIFLDNEPSNETFVCQKVMVSNPIPVQAGDFLGLHLPARISLPIPVVGHGLNGSVLYRDVGDASVTILERMDGLVLHVDAEIEMASPNYRTKRLLSLHTASHTTVTPSTTVTSSTAQTSSADIFQSLSLVLPTPEHSLLSANPAVSISRVAVYSTDMTSESVVIFKSSSSFDLDTQSTIIPYKTLLVSEDRDETRTHVVNKGSAISTALPNATVSRKYPLNWPFISGLIIGAILLVLIAIVSILLVLVVCVRRREDSADDFTTNKPNSLFTATHTDIDQGESSFPMLDQSPSSKKIQVPTLLKTSFTTNTSESVYPCNVYDAPHKISPTSKSSVSSIFSSEEGQQHTSAQPYETPLVTPLSSRLNLYPSTSTLDTTCNGSEVPTKSPLHPQPIPPGTLDRLRVIKIKKPLPKPALTPDKENREAPVLVLPPNPKTPTPEAETVSYDEGCDTVTHSHVRLLEQASIDTNIPSPQDMYYTPPDDETDIMNSLERMNVTKIPREAIQIISHIGTGEFASVAKACWNKESSQVEVAVKSMPPNTDIEDRVKLLKEAAMMGQFRHPNVVQLHGIVTSGTSFMLVLGYLAKGDLRTHLVQLNRETLLPSTPKLLMSYSQQVALGMHYLASKGFVHRDLAARNIFVSENNTCKVGDFGMSRDLANAPYYISKGGKIPVRWTAPEAMYYHKYSTASDVWSYGCVLYEIWSLGRLPFKKYTNAQVLERLDSGYRLPPPPGTPRAIYELMIQTWHPKANLRPEFRNILLQLVRDDTCLLHIPVSDASTSQQASQLGSPLSAGEYMYSELQRAYILQQNLPEDEEEYDSLIGRKYVLSFPTSSADIDYLYNDHNPPQRSFRNQLLTSDTESDYDVPSGHY